MKTMQVMQAVAMGYSADKPLRIKVSTRNIPTYDVLSEENLLKIEATAERIRHLRLHGAPGTTLIGTYFIPNGQSKTVTSDNITSTLRLSLLQFGTTLGISPTDISARSLRASGAMALLCAHVDHDTIRLVGRWRSDEMLRYLHVQAQPVMHDFARRMIAGGEYALLPNNTT